MTPSSPDLAGPPRWPVLGTAVVLEQAPDGPWAPPALTAGGQLEPSQSEAERAFAQGHREGLREGTIQTAERLQPALESLGRMTNAVRRAGEDFAKDRAQNLQALALAVAQQLLMREVRSDPQIVVSLVRRALDMMPPEGPIEVRVQPDELAQLRAGLRLATATVPDGLQLVGDASLVRGDCYVIGPTRIVDGRIDTALRELYERLDDV